MVAGVGLAGVLDFDAGFARPRPQVHLANVSGVVVLVAGVEAALSGVALPSMLLSPVAGAGFVGSDLPSTALGTEPASFASAVAAVLSAAVASAALTTASAFALHAAQGSTAFCAGLVAGAFDSDVVRMTTVAGDPVAGSVEVAVAAATVVFAAAGLMDGELSLAPVSTAVDTSERAASALLASAAGVAAALSSGSGCPVMRLAILRTEPDTLSTALRLASAVLAKPSLVLVMVLATLSALRPDSLLPAAGVAAAGFAASALAASGLAAAGEAAPGAAGFAASGFGAAALATSGLAAGAGVAVGAVAGLLAAGLAAAGVAGFSTAFVAFTSGLASAALGAVPAAGLSEAAGGGGAFASLAGAAGFGVAGVLVMRRFTGFGFPPSLLGSSQTSYLDIEPSFSVTVLI